MRDDLVKSTRKIRNVDMNAKSHQGRMDLGHDKIRMNVDVDRLSNLPDDLIHKILSITSIKHAFGMSVLSSRWRFIWTSMPCLNFSSEDLFPNFVSNFLSRRNNQIQVSSVKLDNWEPVSHESVKRILNYTFSHNVQQLTVSCNLEPNIYIGAPLSAFSSQYLKLLFLRRPLYESSCFMAMPTLDLPALTTLHLDGITLAYEHTDTCIGLLSKCTNLKNLSLSRCQIMGKNALNIFHPQLSNLTLENSYRWLEVVNVVTPQLKNLTIIDCYGKHLISAPSLTSFVMKGCHPLQLISTEGFLFLEKADLCISDTHMADDLQKIVCLLQQLHSVKFLTLNLEILELFSSPDRPISHQPFLFANKKIIKFTTRCPARIYLETQDKFKETKNHLVDSSSSAIFTMVSCEEIRVMRDIVSAHRLIAKLRVLLV